MNKGAGEFNLILVQYTELQQCFASLPDLCNH